MEYAYTGVQLIADTAHQKDFRFTLCNTLPLAGRVGTISCNTVYTRIFSVFKVLIFQYGGGHLTVRYVVLSNGMSMCVHLSCIRVPRCTIRE